MEADFGFEAFFAPVPGAAGAEDADSFYTAQEEAGAASDSVAGGAGVEGAGEVTSPAGAAGAAAAAAAAARAAAAGAWRAAAAARAAVGASRAVQGTAGGGAGRGAAAAPAEAARTPEATPEESDGAAGAGGGVSGEAEAELPVEEGGERLAEAVAADADLAVEGGCGLPSARGRLDKHQRAAHRRAEKGRRGGAEAEPRASAELAEAEAEDAGEAAGAGGDVAARSAGALALDEGGPAGREGGAAQATGWRLDKAPSAVHAVAVLQAFAAAATTKANEAEVDEDKAAAAARAEAQAKWPLAFDPLEPPPEPDDYEDNAEPAAAQDDRTKAYEQQQVAQYERTKEIFLAHKAYEQQQKWVQSLGKKSRKSNRKRIGPITKQAAATLRAFIASRHNRIKMEELPDFFEKYPALYAMFELSINKVWGLYPKLVKKSGGGIRVVGKTPTTTLLQAYSLPLGFDPSSVELPPPPQQTPEIATDAVEFIPLKKKKKKNKEKAVPIPASQQEEKGKLHFQGGTERFWNTVLAWNPKALNAPDLFTPPANGRHSGVAAWAESCLALTMAEAHAELAEAVPKVLNFGVPVFFDLSDVSMGNASAVLKLAYSGDRPPLPADALRPAAMFLVAATSERPSNRKQPANSFDNWQLATILYHKTKTPGVLRLQISSRAAADLADDCALKRGAAVVFLDGVRLLGSQRMAAAAHACRSDGGGMMRRALAAALAGVKGATHMRFDGGDEGGGGGEGGGKGEELDVVQRDDGRCTSHIAPDDGDADYSPALARARDAAVGGLNLSQHAALGRFRALFERDAAGGPLQIVHGPPGCGKTVYLAAALASACAAGKTVLCCAPSNAAVVNALKRYQEVCSTSAAGVDARAVVVGDADALGIRGFDSRACVVSRAYAPCVVSDLLVKLRALQANVIHGSTMIAATATAECDAHLPPNARARVAPNLKSCHGGVGDCFAGLAALVAQLEAEAEHIVLELVKGARVVFSTLTAAGSRVVRTAAPFDLLMVDEAAQATEAEVLLAAAVSRAPRASLIGDPRQLPATLKSQAALAKGLGRSLVARLMDKAGVEASLLDEQHRMDPRISQFPRRAFYGGRLRDAACVVGRPLPFRDGAPVAAFLSQRYAVVDVASGYEARTPSGSVSNRVEAELARRIVAHLARAHGLRCPGRVALITPYAAQASLIGHGARTVDSWQGGEADVVVVSLVRASTRCGPGFASDARRINVSLTRARHALVVLCSAATLERAGGALWQLVEDARSRGALMQEQALVAQLDAAERDAVERGGGADERHGKYPTRPPGWYAHHQSQPQRHAPPGWYAPRRHRHPPRDGAHDESEKEEWETMRVGETPEGGKDGGSKKKKGGRRQAGAGDGAGAAGLSRGGQLCANPQLVLPQANSGKRGKTKRT